MLGRHLLVFVDEVHRFNKAQQDAFLPLIEDGTIVMVGATAENPSFYLNAALLSRLRVLQVFALSPEALSVLLERAAKQLNLSLTPDARELLIQMAQGDGRYLLNLVENILHAARGETLNADAIRDVLQKRPALYDKAGDQHYNLISALHKSVRGSDPDAALYWFARILAGGEDPLYLARRIIRMAAEDIGLADPQALSLAIEPAILTRPWVHLKVSSL